MRVLVAPQPSEADDDTAFDPSYSAVSNTDGASVRELDRRIVIRAAVLAGIAGFVVNTFIPLVGIILTGAFAVLLYRFFGGSSLSLRPALRLGAAAWTVSFAVFSFFLVTAVTLYRVQFQEAMIKRMQAFGFDPASPDIQEMIRIVLSPSGLALTLVFYFMLGILLVSLGVLVATSLGRSRN